MNKLTLILSINIISGFMSLFLFSCDYVDTRLQITNGSNSNISYAFSTDTVLSKDRMSSIDYYISNFISSGKMQKPSKIGGINAWSTFINTNQNQKLNIFFFNVDSLRKYNDIERIITNRVYDRYEYTEKDLEKLNWEIVYKEE